MHAPVAPTAECVALLEELKAPVEHIVLPTTLFEHKIFVGPFQRRFPEAQVWIAPDQWSWPINLPPQFFGIFKTGTLGIDPTPFDDEFEYELLQPPALGVASYVSFTECAFLHKVGIFVYRRAQEIWSEKMLSEKMRGQMRKTPRTSIRPLFKP